MGVLRHDSGQQRHPHGVENVCQTVYGNGKHSGIAVDDFISAVGRRIPLVKGIHIGLDHGPQLRNGPEEIQADLLGLLGSRFLSQLLPENHGQLLVQVVHHVFNEHGNIVMGIVNAVVLIPGEAGIDNAHELSDHIDDHLLVRMGKGVHTVDASAVAVILQYDVDDFFRLLFHCSHSRSSY